MAEPILALRGLSKSFGALKATDDVSLDLRPGEIHALIGPNGAGKSTLIGQIAGSVVPDAGEVWLGGRQITGLSVAARARAGLARSFQVSSLAMEVSARVNVRLAAQGRAGGTYRLWGSASRDSRLAAAAEAALARVGLEARADIPVAELSHGERRLAEMACALALAPRVFLLDEPMAGLGADGTARLTALLDGLRHEAPILLVEHDMDAVFRLADRISVLVYGRVILTGTPDEIRASREVREAYLGEEA
ncbi:ATP-binding cassette domain-containing protein [Limibaculum sp. M0105]|uniref:ATP-binding cassette domain-containing protein n=1 Tax=Thermohalobaculum xanthum TaxID=2753746 RepID=A0A8J7M3N3_9RHOB|nr:ATP-binding cassette domain-containing protein [Thermohalobaculum xanthum]MBK0397598.1 ATP-binding cassette domain-containing protein [Thermohalobaculum xanthum]